MVQKKVGFLFYYPSPVPSEGHSYNFFRSLRGEKPANDTDALMHCIDAAYFIETQFPALPYLLSGTELSMKNIVASIGKHHYNYQKNCSDYYFFHFLKYAQHFCKARTKLLFSA